MDDFGIFLLLRLPLIEVPAPAAVGAGPAAGAAVVGTCRRAATGYCHGDW